MKILTLNVTFFWFDLMVTGNKPVEFRKPTDWIKSRIIDKKGFFKEFDKVRIYRGYTSTFFEADFDYIQVVTENETRFYGNPPTELLIEKGDYMIRFSNIQKSNNL